MKETPKGKLSLPAPPLFQGIRNAIVKVAQRSDPWCDGPSRCASTLLQGLLAYGTVPYWHVLFVRRRSRSARSNPSSRGEVQGLVRHKIRTE
jgi:hypothetical protein